MKIENEFIPYEQALVLKELGFDEPCFAIWSGFDENNFSTTDTIRLFSSKFRINDTQSSFFYGNSPNYKQVSAPTFSQAFRFFREKYNLLLDVVMFYDENQLPLTYKNLQKPKGYFVWDYYDEDFNEQKATIFNTYEEAELECLKKLIEIVKNK